MIEEFAGKTAVVTGAASGIGRALAERFVAEGMKVVLADVEAEALQRVRAEIGKGDEQVIAATCDVTDEAAVQALAARSQDAFGKVHVVCNNAGVFTGGRCWEAPLSDYKWVFDVNLWGVLHGIRAFVPILLEQGEPAHIVNTASMAGTLSSPFTAAYNISKHGVVTLSETLFHELAIENAPISVSVLCPELIDTQIGHSERNRPRDLSREAGNEPNVAEVALREFVRAGLDPAVMADRVVKAIRTDQFYILAEEGGSWRNALDSRLEDIAKQSNPRMAITGAN